MKCDELKAFNSERIYWAVEQVEREAGDIDTLHLDDNLFYIKSEADKVIADLEESHKKEVEQLLMAIVELKKEKEYVVEQTAEVINGQEREIQHHKYKRCFAMFDKCQVRVAHCQLLERYEQRNWWRKWMFKWLELADKLKEAK